MPEMTYPYAAVSAVGNTRRESEIKELPHIHLRLSQMGTTSPFGLQLRHAV
ncbi:hypothetical protein ANO14919_061180 [Xylariales sp. No.14919]|nr:hypothetical protein ANO14919_061180 [Xylariales sp. No.14919]